MTAGLVAALVVVIVALVVLLIVLTARSRRLNDERGRAAAAHSDADAAREAVVDWQRRAEAAQEAAREALERTEDAEARASSAEQHADEARRALTAGTKADGPLEAGWDLERVRAEREWTDVVGPDVDLPVEWEPTVGTVVAIELEVIKEVIGTPAVLQVAEGDDGRRPAVPPVAARLGAELVRRMARAGEELTVVVSDSELSVAHAGTEGELPDLAPLVVAAARAGGHLEASSAEGTVTARFRYP